MIAERSNNGPSHWASTLQALALFAVDPASTGGVIVRGPPGPQREAWMNALAGLFRNPAPRRLPLNISEERLLGGIDLAASLNAGRPLVQKGLLAEANGGIVVITGAERLELGTAAHITAAIDRRKVIAARDSIQIDEPAAFGVVALDEGQSDDEKPPAALLDRLAFHCILDATGRDEAIADSAALAAAVSSARTIVQDVICSDAIIAALVQTAVMMGIDSVRAPILAVRAARAAAALDGRRDVSNGDAELAAQLVLSPRATRLPIEAADQPEPAPDQTPNQPDQSGDEQAVADTDLPDMVLEAALAAIPPGLLAALQSNAQRQGRSKSAGRAGAPQKNQKKGRPLGARQGELRPGARLNIVETLRAAALWQPLRRRSALAGKQRIHVRKEDFRISKFKKRAGTVAIFAVDASGSAALHRLAEAKGAIELLLADCYVRRDSVALIAFRGKTADILLPPTRSLARAKRSLAGLPGGGATPIATGLDAAHTLAATVKRKGQTPSVIVLTDGRANIARDGSPGRPKAEADSLEAARLLALAGVNSLVIDMSPVPAAQSERLAAAMNAKYLPLPYADAASVSRAAKASILISPSPV